MYMLRRNFHHHRRSFQCFHAAIVTTSLLWNIQVKNFCIIGMQASQGFCQMVLPSHIAYDICIHRFRTVLDLDLFCTLIHPWMPHSAYASAFLQIPPRDGHPWCSASGKYCNSRRGLSPPRYVTCQSYNGKDTRK